MTSEVAINQISRGQMEKGPLNWQFDVDSDQERPFLEVIRRK